MEAEGRGHLVDHARAAAASPRLEEDGDGLEVDEGELEVEEQEEEAAAVVLWPSEMSAPQEGAAKRRGFSGRLSARAPPPLQVGMRRVQATAVRVIETEPPAAPCQGGCDPLLCLRQGVVGVPK